MLMLTGDDGAAYSFVLGQVEAGGADKYMIRATFEVSNNSAMPLRFQIGDIRCQTRAGKSISPSAVGQKGSAMFTKFSTAEQEVVSKVGVELQPGGHETFNYLFGSDKSELPLQWSFRGANWSSLQKTPAK